MIKNRKKRQEDKNPVISLKWKLTLQDEPKEGGKNSRLQNATNSGKIKF